jgi:hypothetical protein
MESEGSLPRSQQPSTGPFPKARSIQSMPPHAVFLISILLYTHLRHVLSNGLFPSGFRTSILYAFLFSHIRDTCSAHLILLYLIVLITVG